jgi:GNAT superfamily N-acetyltransferase
MFIIREKRDGDLNSLRALFLQARCNTFTWLNTSQYKLSDFDDQTKEETILVALSSNQVIGFISLWMEGNFIHHLYVEDKHQGKSVGNELLQSALKIMKYPVTLKCLEKNTKAVEFYKKRGFIESEVGVTDDGSHIVFILA